VTRTPFGQMMRTMTCETCNGEGRVPAQPCRECADGAPGEHQDARGRCPPGIADGQRIRLSGHGHAGDAGAPAGDLYVFIVCARIPLRKGGRRPAHRHRCPAPLAALGGTLEVPTLQGSASIDLPAGSQPGEILTLRGEGCRRCGAAAEATCG